MRYWTLINEVLSSPSGTMVIALSVFANLLTLLLVYLSRGLLEATSSRWKERQLWLAEKRAKRLKQLATDPIELILFCIELTQNRLMVVLLLMTSILLGFASDALPEKTDLRTMTFMTTALMAFAVAFAIKLLDGTKLMKEARGLRTTPSSSPRGTDDPGKAPEIELP